MWDDLAKGALGAVVIADTRRLEESYPAVDYYELQRLPFIVAINTFDDAEVHPLEQVRAALNVPANVPIVRFDARDRASVKGVLLALLDQLLLAQRSTETAARRHVQPT